MNSTEQNLEQKQQTSKKRDNKYEYWGVIDEISL